MVWSMTRMVIRSHIRPMTRTVSRPHIRPMTRTVSRPVAWFGIRLTMFVIMSVIWLYIRFIGRLVAFIARLSFRLYCLRRILSFRRSLSCNSAA